MNPNTIKHLAVLVLGLVLALLLGIMIGTGDLTLLFLFSYLMLGLFVLTAPGFVPLIAVGLVSPFIIPIPYIRTFPFVLIIMGVCAVKLFFWRAIDKRTVLSWNSSFHPLFFAFFAWVGLRYCMNPVMPNLAGIGSSVSGFRSYLSYGVCVALLGFLPFCVRRPSDALRLIRWMVGLSVFFISLLVPLMFTQSQEVGFWLTQFGLFVTAFDNGWLRFVVLPGFGLTLITVVMFPRLLPLSVRARIAFGVLGTAAIFLGGNRTSLAMAFLIVLTVALVRRKILLFSSLLAGTAVMLVTFHLIGETVQFRGKFGAWRILSLTSRRIAEQTDAAGNVEWRKVRWHRALQEIRSNPLFGKGYGGLENAWIAGSSAAVESALVEIDLTSGGIHNGYLSGAYALGIPAAVLFVAAILWQIGGNARRARRLSEHEPVLSDLHTFVCANLVSLVAANYAGNDLNSPITWFYLGFGVLLGRFATGIPHGAGQDLASSEVEPHLPPHRNRALVPVR
jgi:O-antigen ligase